MSFLPEKRVKQSECRAKIASTPFNAKKHISKRFDLPDQDAYFPETGVSQ
jgi:hypothetical protein